MSDKLLNGDRVRELWASIKELLSSNTSIEGDIPLIPITEADYQSLSEDEKHGETAWLITDARNVSSSGSSDKAEVYSTEETKIGTWIDGKPLYRRVYTGVISESAWTIISTDIPPIEFAIFYCSAFVSPSYYSIPINTNNGKSFFACNSEEKKISIYNDINIFVGKKCWIIAEYTKTTD